MVISVGRGIGFARDTAQMIAVHLGRITGVLTDTVARAGNEVGEMVLDCRDVAKAATRAEPVPLDLPPGTERVDIRSTDGSPTR